ncbi:Pao retrotransposon peptidase [Popillia japonica]|uniref:Pao retrotransposon peptidase n=1 Tax=Popillia japonica TaxID=7064 RepID=A0AAW1MBP8_POPJA
METQNYKLYIYTWLSIIQFGSSLLELRNWWCNKPELCANFQINKNLDSSIVQLGEHETNKTLGICWNATGDIIHYATKVVPEKERLSTKRIILSEVPQIIDSLGLLAPIIIISCKLLIQALWQAKISWDEQVPEELRRIWYKCREESQKIIVLKISLPRLELCSAVLVAQLVHKIGTALKSEFDKQYQWSNSTVTLSWIRACPRRWKTFVANRVSEIQRLTNIEDWYHVRSKETPADIMSHGMSVEDLQDSELWWSGPYGLYEDFLQLESIDERTEDKVPELRQTLL